MKKLIAILTVSMALGVSGYLSAGPLPFSYVCETIATYVSTLTSDAQDQIDLKAPIASPTFTGVVTSPSFVTSKVSGVAGLMGVYDAATTETFRTGWKGAADTADDMWFQFSNDDPAAGQQMTFAAPATGVSQISWQYSGAALTPVTGDADTFDDAGIFSLVTVNMYGGTFVANATGTILLATPVAGMSFTVIVATPVAVIIDPQVGDAMMTDGVLGAAGENITSLSAAGDIAFVQYYSANTWLVTTNGWTPE